MRRQTLCTLALVLGSVSAADGQARKPRVAGIAPAPAPAPQTPPVQDSHDYDYHQPVAYGTVPVIVDEAGRIYADFGYGYEQVLRSCAATYGSGYVQPGYTAPVYTPPSYRPPSYSPPSYSATPARPSSASPSSSPAPSRAAEQQASSNAARGAPRTAGIAPIPPQAPAQPAYLRGPACWTTDRYGRIFVLRP